jgi:hypothetical protein
MCFSTAVRMICEYSSGTYWDLSELSGTQKQADPIDI